MLVLNLSIFFCVFFFTLMAYLGRAGLVVLRQKNDHQKSLLECDKEKEFNVHQRKEIIICIKQQFHAIIMKLVTDTVHRIGKITHK